MTNFNEFNSALSISFAQLEFEPRQQSAGEQSTEVNYFIYSLFSSSHTHTKVFLHMPTKETRSEKHKPWQRRLILLELVVIRTNGAMFGLLELYAS